MPENFRSRLSVVAGKVEAAAGVEETIAAGDASAVIADPEAEDNIDLIERNFVNNDLSQFAPLIGVKDRRIKFVSELKGSGTPGTPPSINPYLRGCGMTVVNDPGVSDTYTLNGGIDSLTVARFFETAAGAGLKKTIKGAMGAWQLSGRAGDAVQITFDFLGQYLNVVDVAAPNGIVKDVTIPPQMLNIALTIGGHTPRISQFTINGGQQVTVPTDVSTNGVQGRGLPFIGGTRRMELTFDPQLDSVADHDWYGRLRDGTPGALSMTIGSVAGNRFTITAPNVQYISATEGEREEAAILNVTARLNRGASGDDEFQIVFN